MLHPRARGTVKWIAPAGEYTIVDTVLKTEFNGKETEHSMLQVRDLAELFLVFVFGGREEGESRDGAYRSHPRTKSVSSLGLACATAAPLCRETGGQPPAVDRPARLGCPVPVSHWTCFVCLL